MMGFQNRIFFRAVFIARKNVLFAEKRLTVTKERAIIFFAIIYCMHP